MRTFLEAYEDKLTPEELRSLRMIGSDVVDHFETNNYKFYIVETPLPPPLNYQLAIQYGDYSAIPKDPIKSAYDLQRGVEDPDINDQFKKVKSNPQDALSAIGPIKEKIEEWLDKYGTLSIASYNAKKVGKYKNLLSYLGFDVQETNFGGHRVLILRN